MPQILNILGFTFFFYSREHEPIHVHVKGKGGEAKIDLEPDVNLVKYKNFKRKDLKKVLELTEINREYMIQRWLDHFKNK